MSLYDVLLKNNMIEFDKVLLEKYYLLDIDEVDVVLLIKVYNTLKNSSVLDASKIASTMKQSASDVSKRIVGLVEKGYITLDIAEDGSESVKIDGIINRLHECLMEEDEKEASCERKNIVKEVSSYASNAFSKVLSPIDLQLINHLVNEDGYSAEELKDAIDECVIKHKMQLKYVDALLQSRKEQPKEVVDPDLQEKFNNVFRKK